MIKKNGSIVTGAPANRTRPHSPAMEPTPERTAHSAMLLRVVDRQCACVLLKSSQSVVHIVLDPPLSPRSHTNAQAVNSLAPVPATVWLGAYSTAAHRFTQCVMEAQLPEQSYTRISYSQRRPPGRT